MKDIPMNNLFADSKISPRVTEPEKSRVCKFCVNVELEIPKNNRRKNHGAY